MYPYNCNVSFKAFCTYNDTIFYSSNIYNGLFKIEKDTLTPSFIGVFPDEAPFRNSLHSKAIIYKDNIIFIPRYAKNPAVFSPITCEITTMDCTPWPGEVVNDSVLIDNCLWILYSKYAAGIIKLNLDTFTVETIINYKDLPLGNFVRPTANILGNSVCRKGDTIYAAVWDTSRYITVNTHNEAVKVIDTEITGSRFSSVAATENDLFFISSDSNIVYRYVPAQKKYSAFTVPDAKSSECSEFFNSIISIKGRIIILPAFGEHIYSFNNEYSDIITFCNFPEGLAGTDIELTQKWRRFFAYELTDDCILIPPFNQNMFLRIDISGRNCFGIKYTYDTEKMGHCFEEIYRPLFIASENEKSVIYESEFYDLNDFICQIGK